MSKKLLFVIALIGAMSMYYLSCQKKESYALWNILDEYGYKTDAQKKALEQLMQQASILAPNQTFEDRFPVRATQTEVLQDILDLVHLTQEHFTIRKGHQERWETQAADWMNEHSKKIREELTTLGFVHEIKPTITHPDAICILGARMGSMISRIGYAAELVNQGELHTQNLILLAGERKLTVGLDGSEAELFPIAERSGKTIVALTETDLIKEAYRLSALDEKMPTHVIDTPAGDLPRPTTETTTLELIKWLSAHPDVKTIVFFSNQPYVKYQEAVIGHVLRARAPHIKFEVVGAHLKPTTELKELVGSLGSEIWALTPDILTKLGLQITDEKLIKGFTELYTRQPFIYKNVEKLFVKA